MFEDTENTKKTDVKNPNTCTWNTNVAEMLCTPKIPIYVSHTPPSWQ